MFSHFYNQPATTPTYDVPDYQKKVRFKYYSETGSCLSCLSFTHWKYTNNHD